MNNKYKFFIMSYDIDLIYGFIEIFLTNISFFSGKI